MCSLFVETELSYRERKPGQAGGMIIAHPLQEMVDAHVPSILLLAPPFRKETSRPYNFEDQMVSKKIRALIPIML